MSEDNPQTFENFDNIQGKHLMHAWSSQGSYDPIPVSETNGCWIHTPNGRKIFDLRSAHECMNLGFRNSKVLQAMREQMEEVVFVTDDFATEPTARLAKLLAKITPGGSNKRVFFSQSGAAAIEAAIKAARFYQYVNCFQKEGGVNTENRQYPYPYKIISRYRSYHGATTGAMTASGDPRRWCQEPLEMPGVKYAPDPYCYRCPLNKEYPSCNLECANYIDKMIELEGGSDEVAAVLVEPIVGSNGIIPPPKEYLSKVRAICDKWNVLLIADEIMTGMGRTGEMFAVDHYNVAPDIITMGKALGAYCPLGATIFNEEISRTFEDNLFCHGQSYTGHALASAGALSSIKVLREDDIIEHAKKMGKYLGKELKNLAGTHESVGDIRGLGLFWTIELVRNRETKEPFRKPTEKYVPTVVSKIAHYMLQEQNIYMPGDKFGFWIVPPLIVNKEEIDFLVESIDDALKISDKKVE